MASADRYLAWGGGGHGKVVADLIRAVGFEMAGFVDADPAKLGGPAEPGGARVELEQDELLSALAGGQALPLGASVVVVAIGANAARLAAARRLGDCLAPALVHPSAAVSPTCELGRGTVVFANAVVNSASRIGCAVIVNSGAIVEHDCLIDDGVHVSPGAVLAGSVRVGARSWIGARAVVIQGVTIGQDVIVGAGAVVLHDLPDGVTVVGNPARILRRVSV